MKIAFSADLHLTSQATHPERFHALESILKRMLEEEISTLIIAGDLFDKEAQEYADFERLVNKKAFAGLEILIINGNHDAGLKSGSLKCDNVRIYDQPTLLKETDYGIDLLLVPYDPRKTLGEIISAEKGGLRPKAWVLVSHGDWLGGAREANPYEQGVYMPLTRGDMDINEPAAAVLGHIHKAYDSGSVVIPGSPCGLNITETGLRSFVVLNTNNRHFQRIPIETDVIYLDERMVLYPMPDEAAYLSTQIEAKKTSWGIPEGAHEKIILRLKVEGYCANPQLVKEAVSQGFKGYQFHKDEGIDFYGLKSSDDVEKNTIAVVIQDAIGALELRSGDGEPEREQILLSALDVIYGN
ncbi:MAG: metallophosphoesterase family protein [Pelolinea sp.]|nr:metallophosphoesterase family protein [Pelolinea sp.]